MTDVAAERATPYYNAKAVEIANEAFFMIEDLGYNAEQVSSWLNAELSSFERNLSTNCEGRSTAMSNLHRALARQAEEFTQRAALLRESPSARQQLAARSLEAASRALTSPQRGMGAAEPESEP